MGALTPGGGIVAPSDGIGTLDSGNVAGSVFFGGTVELSISLGFDPSDDGSQSITLISNDGLDPVGFFNSSSRFAIGANILEEGESFCVGAQDFTITYAGGSDANERRPHYPARACERDSAALRGSRIWSGWNASPRSASRDSKGGGKAPGVIDPGARAGRHQRKIEAISHGFGVFIRLPRGAHFSRR